MGRKALPDSQKRQPFNCKVKPQTRSALARIPAELRIRSQGEYIDILVELDSTHGLVREFLGKRQPPASA